MTVIINRNLILLVTAVFFIMTILPTNGIALDGEKAPDLLDWACN